MFSRLKLDCTRISSFACLQQPCVNIMLLGSAEWSFCVNKLQPFLGDAYCVLTNQHRRKQAYKWLFRWWKSCLPPSVLLVKSECSFYEHRHSGEACHFSCFGKNPHQSLSKAPPFLSAHTHTAEKKEKEAPSRLQHSLRCLKGPGSDIQAAVTAVTKPPSLAPTQHHTGGLKLSMSVAESIPLSCPSSGCCWQLSLSIFAFDSC